MNVKTGRLILSIITANMAGLLGSVFTAQNIPVWYASIQKPALTPPNWIFAPVWTALFIMMGVSLYLVWEKGLEKNRLAVSVFGVQLGLNTLWSFLFFGLNNPFYAFIEIIILWLAIAATIFLFRRISRKAAWLLVPYIIWVSFAAFLNYSVWILNA